MTVGNTGRGPGAERSDMGDLRGIDRARAERLLAGTDPGTDPIGRLLAAARAPGTPAELRGEAAALGAFRIGATREPRGRVTARRRLWPRLRTSAVAMVAAGGVTVAAAGVAVAAAIGVLPNPLVDPGPGVGTSAPVPPLSTQPDPHSPSNGAGGTSPGRSGQPASPGHGSSGAPASSPDPSLVGLCNAYRAHVEHSPDEGEPGQWLNGPAFQPLVAAAGGVDQVPAFCDSLLGPATGRGNQNGTANTDGATVGATAGATDGAANNAANGAASADGAANGNGAANRQ
jgi:hypothetical protein